MWINIHCMGTPRKFNIDPENRPSQKETHLPTIIFQGLWIIRVHVWYICVELADLCSKFVGIYTSPIDPLWAMGYDSSSEVIIQWYESVGGSQSMSKFQRSTIRKNMLVKIIYPSCGHSVSISIFTSKINDCINVVGWSTSERNICNREIGDSTSPMFGLKKVSNSDKNPSLMCEGTFNSEVALKFPKDKWRNGCILWEIQIHFWTHDIHVCCIYLCIWLIFMVDEVNFIPISYSE